MNKIKIVALMSVMSLVLGLFGPAQAVNAACSQHSKYVDRIESTSTPSNSTHNVNTGYYVEGKPIYRICTVTTVYITHGVYCGVCNTRTGGYTQKVDHHSLSH